MAARAHGAAMVDEVAETTGFIAERAADAESVRAPGRSAGGWKRLAVAAVGLGAAAALCLVPYASRSRSQALRSAGGGPAGLVALDGLGGLVKVAELDMRLTNCGSACPKGGCCHATDCEWTCEQNAHCQKSRWSSTTMLCEFFGGAADKEAIQDEARKRDEYIKKQGSWLCHDYEGDQDDAWCKKEGNSSGFEYRFFGADSPCDHCWCCKRHAAEEPKTTAKPKTKHVAAHEPKSHEGSCAEMSDNCLDYGCCNQEGMQCYAKDETWGSCKAMCDTESGWSCEEVGERTERVLDCTFAGEDCMATKLCCNPGLHCYEMDIQTAWCTSKPEPSWSGKVLGGSHHEFAVQPASHGEPTAGTSMFCFQAVLPGSAEVALTDAARERNASIFACECSRVYHSLPSIFVHQGSWNSWVNTDSFIHVWKQVEHDGLYKKYEWTVKCDPDAVFISQRLKASLHNLHAPADAALYVKNCAISFGFLGAIEVFSRKAMEVFFLGYQGCRKSMGNFSGEDGFMKGAMDMLGVGYMTDVAILRTPSDPACVDGSRSAFHPHKQVADWVNCYNTATGVTSYRK